MFKRLLLISVLLIVVIASAWALTQRIPQAEGAGIAIADVGDASGFARAYEPVEFQFPADHGPHFDFQSEWWYYTGNLQDAEGNHYGYQLTFFRRGLTPGEPASEQDSLATNQIYFAHFAITDAAGNMHVETERFSRGAGGLAGAQGEPFKAWIEDWNSTAIIPDASAVHLQATDVGIGASLDLTLRAVKPLVKHGVEGLSSKSEEPGNASYYISFTRMATEGQLTVNGKTFTVIGESWFDHEWSTKTLGPHAVGWDWFSLQLSDGRELMLFQMRRDDGDIESVSGGTLIEANGTSRHLNIDEIELTAGSTWKSSETQANYPVQWRVRVPSAQIDVMIEPWVADQEMNVTTVYWEGAVKLSGTSNGVNVAGNGFVELTGYNKRFSGTF
jgi:predicted secreted hydrolase